MNHAIYLYGFVPERVRPPAGGLLGVGGEPVEVVPVNGFGAVIARLPVAEYGASAVAARLRDLAWVGTQGIRHEQVVAWFVDHGQIVPVRLLTLYGSLDALLREATARGEWIGERLRRFAGHREWDLKVTYSAERLGACLGRWSESVRAVEAEIAGAAPGRRFLLERRRAELVRAETPRIAHVLAEKLLGALRELAIAHRTLPLPGEVDARSVVLHAALLVEKDREEAVRLAVDRRAATLADGGLEVSFSGPWAPYRFVGNAA